MGKVQWLCFVLFSFFILSLGTSDGYHTPKPASRACIIGAGYCGLGAARFMKEFGVNFTVLEATRHVGGTWRFDPHVGTDEDGLPMFTSMYRNLRINIPRMTMEYTRFPFPEGSQAFPTGECFYKYIKLFARHFDLYDHIQFRSLVTSVKWVGNHWNVTYMKTDTNANHTEECDFVVVANGEFRIPLSPKFDMQDTFEGTIMHSHDYREPGPFRNRRVLVVGAGPSGFDIVVHMLKVASKTFHSHHRNVSQKFPDAYVKKPDIKRFTANGVVFVDDSFEEIDDVILCTGYDLSYPFLDKSSGIVATNKFVLPLYQHMVNIIHPSMVFVGTPKLLSNSIREAQAEYAAALAAGKFKLPSRGQMLSSWLSDVETLKASNTSIVYVNSIGDDMDSYFAKLAEESGIYKRPPVLARIKAFNARIRLEDLLNYRDYDFEIIGDHHFKRKYNPREGNPCPIDI